MNVYINGCSYCAGTGYYDTHDWWAEKEDDEKQFSFGAHMAKLLGGEQINNAVCGSSNQKIVQDTINDLEKMESLNDLLVVIGLTHDVRKGVFIEYNGEYNYQTIFYKDNEINDMPIVIGNKIKEWQKVNGQLFLNDKMLFLENYALLMLLFSYLEKRNAAFIIFQSMSEIVPVVDDDYSKYLASVSNSKHYVDTVFEEFATSNKYPRYFDQHPGQEAHKQWANFLYNEAKNRNII